jgi:hypothetical protein
LSVVLDDGYVPAAGTMWVIGTAGGIGGSFVGVTAGFEVGVSGGNLVLVAVPEPAGVGLLVSGGILLIARRRN